MKFESFGKILLIIIFLYIREYWLYDMILIMRVIFYCLNKFFCFKSLVESNVLFKGKFYIMIFISEVCKIYYYYF